MDKRIGFFEGLKATWGFKPYFYLLMLELFSWLALQVRGKKWRCLFSIILFVDTVHSRKLSSLYQVLPWTGDPVSLPDSSASCWFHFVHANVAVGYPQVWQEDNFLRGHVDPPTSATFHALPRPFPLPRLSSKFFRCNGSFLCLSTTMVRESKYTKIMVKDPPRKAQPPYKGCFS